MYFFRKYNPGKIKKKRAGSGLLGIVDRMNQNPCDCPDKTILSCLIFPVASCNLVFALNPSTGNRRTNMDKIDAASFEATAITAAIGFEQKAVKMYTQRSEEATDPEEKKMYAWLSTWEKTHLKKLMTLEESLIESVWNDNNFWPF